MAIAATDPAGEWPEDLDIGVYADTSMAIPGQGSPGDRCGEFYPSRFCDQCGEPHFSRSQCNGRECPNCWKEQVTRRAISISHRLGAARHAADESWQKRAIHAGFSAPEGEIRTLVDVADGFQRVYDLAREKGMRGGVVVFHGWRPTEEAKEIFRAACELGRWDTDSEGGIWDWIRQYPKDWRSLCYWSPHYHVIGLCEDFEADDPEEQDGWVARRLRALEPFRIDDSKGFNDMIGTSWYILSHMGFETGSSRDGVRWFGELSTTKFATDDVDGSELILERLQETADSHQEEEPDECDRCGTVGEMSPIWDAGTALMDKRWCKRIGREQQQRLTAAFEWMIGDLEPPPGLAHPSTEEQARETLEALV